MHEFTMSSLVHMFAEPCSWIRSEGSDARSNITHANYVDIFAFVLLQLGTASGHDEL